MQVREILAIKGNALFTTTPQHSVGHAVAVMAEHDVGSLVVMEHGRMVGMLTFREIVRAVHRHGGAIHSLPIGESMVSEPVTVDPEMEVDDLRRTMVEHRMRYLPVMEEGTLLGVISFHDVAKAVLEEQSFENRMLKDYIRNWPAEEKQDES